MECGGHAAARRDQHCDTGRPTSCGHDAPSCCRAVRHEPDDVWRLWSAGGGLGGNWAQRRGVALSAAIPAVLDRCRRASPTGPARPICSRF